MTMNVVAPVLVLNVGSISGSGEMSSVLTKGVQTAD